MHRLMHGVKRYIVQAKPVDNLTHRPGRRHDPRMAGMKIVSMLDHELVKARQVAQRDLEQLQRQLLAVTTSLADSLVALADRVTALEQRGTHGSSG